MMSAADAEVVPASELYCRWQNEPCAIFAAQQGVRRSVPDKPLLRIAQDRQTYAGRKPIIAFAIKRFLPHLHGRGKHVDAAPGGPIEKMVREGTEVLAVELRGFGETAMNPWRTTPADVAGSNGAECFVAYMLGRSLAGMRAEEVILSAKLLSSFTGSTPRRIELVAVEDAAIPAMHACALAPALFSSIRLVRTIDSWERVIEASLTRRQFEGVVHGALRVYDLPKLAALAGGVQLVDPVDAEGQPLGR